MSQEFSGVPPIVDDEDWNAIVDHAFEKLATYIVRKSGSNFEAIHGKAADQAGKLLYSGLDAEADVLQPLFDDLTDGDLVYLKANDYPITNGLTFALPPLKRSITLYFEGGGLNTAVATGARFTTTNDITLITVPSLVSCLRIINGSFKGITSGGTLPLVDNGGNDNIFKRCMFLYGGTGLKTTGSRVKLLYSQFKGQESYGVQKSGRECDIIHNRITALKAGATYLSITDAKMDLIYQNLIRNSTGELNQTGIDLNIPSDGDVHIFGGVVADCKTNIKVSDALGEVTLDNIRIANNGTDYGIDVVNGNIAVNIKGVWIELEKDGDNSTGIRQQDGTVRLFGDYVTRLPGVTDGQSWSKIAGTTIQRGCYSFDGLLEAL